MYMSIEAVSAEAVSTDSVSIVKQRCECPQMLLLSDHVKMPVDRLMLWKKADRKINCNVFVSEQNICMQCKA